MARSGSPAVVAEGLRELRRDLRAFGSDATKELQDGLKDAAGLVASRAALLAPRKSGRLARLIRASAVGNRAFITARLPYAAVQEWGGVIRPKGAPVRIARHRFVGRAIEDEADHFMNRLGDNIDALARRLGWK